MGDEVLLHLVEYDRPSTDVFFLDTSTTSPRPSAPAMPYAAMLPIRMRTVLPLQTVAQQDAEYGPSCTTTTPTSAARCARSSRWRRALHHRAWVTGMRARTPPRVPDIAVVRVDERRGMVKVNAIAAWTAEDVEALHAGERVFENPCGRSDSPPSGARRAPPSPTVKTLARAAGRAVPNAGGLHT
jgi:phosphoadenosine phosphosulfate reductase